MLDTASFDLPVDRRRLDDPRDATRLRESCDGVASMASRPRRPLVMSTRESARSRGRAYWCRTDGRLRHRRAAHRRDGHDEGRRGTRVRGVRRSPTNAGAMFRDGLKNMAWGLSQQWIGGSPGHVAPGARRAAPHAHRRRQDGPRRADGAGDAGLPGVCTCRGWCCSTTTFSCSS